MRSKLITVGGLSLALLGAGWAASVQAGLPPGFANKTGLPTNFPISLPAGTVTGNGYPVWADLGLTGGRKSLIFTTFNHELFVVNFDGKVAPGFPVMLPAQANTPTVADLGAGIPAIVVGFGGQTDYVANGGTGGVRAYRRDGTVMWTVNSFNPSGMIPPNAFPLGVVSVPAVGDVDGDGHAEVVWGGFDGHIWVVDGLTGVPNPGWPLFIHDTIWSSPALYDLDSTGKLEIIIGTDSHVEQQAVPTGVPGTIQGGRLHVLRSDATEFPGFPYDVDQAIFSAPVVGDIDGDGKPEIVFGTGTYYGNPAPCGSGIGAPRRRTVYALHCDGTPVAGFGAVGMTLGEVVGSPALADLDGDGHPEVIVSDYDCSTGNAKNYNVYAFKGNGVKLWTVNPKSYSGANLSAGQPVVAHVFNNPNPEILVPTNTEIAIISAAGVQLTTSSGAAPLSSLYMETAASGVAVDVDNGFVNVASVSGAPFPSPTQAKVYVWTTPVVTLPAWGQIRKGPDHTGAIPGSGACGQRPAVSTSLHPITPCRLVDTRVGSGLLGGPALAAHARRDFPIAGVCGIPAGAVSISANVTVTNMTAAGDLTLFPSDVGQPIATSISFQAFKTRGNNAFVYLSATGSRFTVYNDSAAPLDFILDVNGYFQ